MEIDRSKVEIKIDIDKDFETSNINNYVEKNELVEILKKQIDGWKISLNGIIESRSNKCIILYQSFVILELITKARFFLFKQIRDYDQEININGFNRPKTIGHKIDAFIEELLNNDEITNMEKNIFRKIKEKIEQLEKFTDLEKIDKYPDLRYNLNNIGEIIEKDISVPKQLIKTVKGVIEFANLW